ncbi:Gldg family protein [Fulvivirga maritima]|uniref:DUF4350 domain-containing protein n=1 Tax=Fulvivirga maritima TaxID=2904247 RepID=UPI001F21D140|nr:DUF4350 domain-containing protein [Fulvivirga maritima]UII24723.1 Gldg family protein [Fulvivirga maritima]
MKTIKRIAKTELNTMFYSPVAWVVLVIFTVQASWQFFNQVERMERAQRLGDSLGRLTSYIFSGYSGVFTIMQDNLYLYVPLLTMGLISREINSGSIKLLYSSPIKIRDIVLGKFMAIAGYCLLFIGVLSLLAIASWFYIDNLDVTFILSGLLGLYLLICTYSAIGLFMSSLTSYQVVAAISTLVVLAALNFVGSLWQDINFVRDITYFLSIAGRADEMKEGLIVSKDVLYFLLVTALFVGLCILKLSFERESKTVAGKFGRYAALVVLVLGLGYVSSLPFLSFYHDMSFTKYRTLTQNSQKVVKQIDGPVKLTTYVNLLDANYHFGAPYSRNYDKEAFEKYIRFLPQLEMEYVYYYDSSKNEDLYNRNPRLGNAELAKKIAETINMDIADVLTPEEIKRQINLEPEENRLVRFLSYNGKETPLRMYDDMIRFPQEKEITAAIKRLVVSPPHIVFTTGHQERSIEKRGDRNYKTGFNEITFRYSLINQGFDVSSVDLDNEDIPDNTDILVIADPKLKLSQKEIGKVKKYLAEGKDLLVFTEPGSTEAVNPLVNTLGIRLSSLALVQKNEETEPEFLKGLLTEAAMKIGQLTAKPEVSISGGVGINVDSVSSYTVTPFIKTPNKPTWFAETGLTVLSDSITNKPSMKSVTVLVALQKEEGQKIIVGGDADLLSNSELRRSEMGNFQFMTNLFSWLTNDEFPIDTTRPPFPDDTLLLDADQVFINKIAFVGLLPLLIIVSAAVMLIRRNRK